ncbi:MAG TPA: thioredoxin [Candidatus Thermoplasmatota archaeon]|nr:thioredoxin [Candidatus Thermoplasmatota archaeon]
MDELEELRRKKLSQLQKQYMNGGKTLEKTWPDTPVVMLDADLDEQVKKYPVVVVDCWAAWCGPCRMIGPVVEELAKDLKGKIVFGKLNVDENPQTSMKYRIMSIPTLLIFKNGALVDRLIGAMPKEMLLGRLKPYTG